MRTHQLPQNRQVWKQLDENRTGITIVPQRSTFNVQPQASSSRLTTSPIQPVLCHPCWALALRPTNLARRPRPLLTQTRRRYKCPTSSTGPRGSDGCQLRRRIIAKVSIMMPTTIGSCSSTVQYASVPHLCGDLDRPERRLCHGRRRRYFDVDKRLMIMKDPEPQLVAVAKVSFTLNNMTRRRPPVDKRMPR